MKTLIHISDLHIGLSAKEFKGAQRVFSAVKSRYAGLPVLITGDLTDSGTKNQFQKIRKMLDDLAKTNPILQVPGNHDYAWKGLVFDKDHWKNWVKTMGQPLGWKQAAFPWMEEEYEPVGIDGLGVWQDDDCAYFGVDSGDPEDKKHTAKGFISKRLADALKICLIKYKDKTRIVLLHHHPFDDGFFMKLDGAKRLLDAVKGNCEILLFGHDHHLGVWENKSGVPLMAASHKSSDPLFEGNYFIGLIEIDNPGTANPGIRHRLCKV